jgi:hypothetical protein
MKLVTFQKFRCYDKKYECLQDKLVTEVLVVINAEHVVKINQRKPVLHEDKVYYSEYYCEHVQGKLAEVVAKLSSL